MRDGESMTDLGIAQELHSALKDSEYDGLLVVGADNVQYLGGVPLPFQYYRFDQWVMVFWPQNSEPVCICPVELESTVRHLGRIDRIHTYCPTGADPRAAVAAVTRLARDSVETGATIGVDTRRIACDFYEALQQALPEMMFSACDGWLGDLRMVKTASERELLEDVAYATDHGINGSLHHVIVAYPRTQMTEAEEIRVHCLERRLVETGYHSVAQVAAGADAQKLWPLCSLHGFNYGYSSTARREAGQMVRVAMRATRDGYWSDASRIVVMGEPSVQQRETYENLVTLRNALLNHIKSGVKCSDVFRSVKGVAEKKGIELISELGFGHGIGVTTHEAPYLTEDDDTELESGMVLVLDPVIYGSDRELVRSKDTVVVTDSGCQIVGWWKDWREPYIPATII
jgi:Xaa-Pro aminopeptidase